MAWVKVPSVSVGTMIYMYYGNPGATDQQQATSVWDADYKGVWHLKEATGTNLADATSNALTCTQVNSPTQGTGQIDGSLTFDGSTQYSYNIAYATNVVDNYTVEAWMKPGSLNQFSYVVYNGTDGLSSASSGYGFGMGGSTGGSSGNYLTGLIGNVAYMVTTYQFPSISSWYHVVMERSGGTTTFYVNGAAKTPTFGTIPIGVASYFTIGCQATGPETPSRYFNGTIDEVRISNAVRSADWITTEYNNQSAPSTFYAVAAQESHYVWNKSGSDDWQVPGNWTPSRTSPSANDVLIFSGVGSTVTNIPTQTIGQLLISGGLTLNFTAASTGNILTVNDALSTSASDVLNLGSGLVLGGTLSTLANSGKIQTAVLTATSTTPLPSGKTWGGTVEYNGPGAQTAVGGTYTTLKTNNSTGVTLGGAATVTTLTIGDVTANSVFSDGGFTITTAATLNLNTGKYICAAATFPWGAANVSSGIVNYKVNGAQTVKGGITYGTLKINNTTGAVLGAATTVTILTIGDETANSIFSDGGFVITPGASSVLNLTGGTYNLGSATVGTTWPAWSTRNFTAGTTVGYTSAVAQTVSSIPSYPNLTFSGAGVKTTAAGMLSVGGTWSVTGGAASLNTNNTNVTVTGDITGSATITSGTTTIIAVSGNLTKTGTFTASTGTVICDGAAQTVAPYTYYNLTLSGSLVKTFATTPTITALLSIEGTATVTVTTGVVTYGAGATLQYNTPIAVTTSGEEWITPFAATGGVIIKNTGAIIMDGAKTFNPGTVLSIYPGAVLSSGSYNLVMNGDFSNSGTFIPGSNTVTFNLASGTVVQNILGTTKTTFYNLTLNNTAGLNDQPGLIVNNLLTLTSGRIVTGASTAVTMGPSASVSSAGSGKYIYGNVEWNIATGTSTKNFFIGDATNYTPVSITFNSVTVAGSLTVNTTATDHPHIVSSGSNLPDPSIVIGL